MGELGVEWDAKVSGVGGVLSYEKKKTGEEPTGRGLG